MYVHLFSEDRAKRKDAYAKRIRRRSRRSASGTSRSRRTCQEAEKDAYGIWEWSQQWQSTRTGFSRSDSLQDSVFNTSVLCFDLLLVNIIHTILQGSVNRVSLSLSSTRLYRSILGERMHRKRTRHSSLTRTGQLSRSNKAGHFLRWAPFSSVVARFQVVCEV